MPQRPQPEPPRRNDPLGVFRIGLDDQLAGG
jgi:hypothetical protein